MVALAGSQKAAGAQKLFKPSAQKFLEAVFRRITPPLDLVASPVATVLLAAGVVVLPLG
jgi:hypothetical protein